MSASETASGRPQNPGPTIDKINAFNNPAMIVLFPNATFGFVASNQPAGDPSGFPVYGTVKALPNGYLQLMGNTNTYPSGSATNTTFVGGVIFPSQGRLYASMTLIVTGAYSFSYGSSTLLTPYTGMGTYLMPIQVVGQ
jgi:hypothetical protein